MTGNFPVPVLTVTVNGQTYTEQQAEEAGILEQLLDQLQLSAWPKAAVSETGVGVWTVQYTDLP